MYELPFKNVTIPFKRFAAKVDCSHNAVWNLPSLKKWIDILSQLGYNSLMLYCEDTYEIDGHPYFGYGRGRYAKAELKELDTYALAHKVELIPSISALDSLPTIFRWPQYAALNDTGSILLSDDAQTYALIEGMLTTCAECFTSRVIDINMDPAPMLGRGKHQSIHGYQPIREVFDRHAEKVHALAAKLGFKAVLISEKNGSKPHRAAERWSVGDVWVRNAFNPENRYSIDQLRSQVAAAIADGTQNMIVRFFGDDGCECARFAGLPSPFWTSQTAKGIRDEAAIKNAFEETFDIAFDDFPLLDLVGNASAGEHGSHPTRYILYNGPFIGLMDLTIPDHTRVDHETLLKQLAPLCNHPEWGYLFQTLHALCAVAAAKCDGRHSLSCRLRCAGQGKAQHACGGAAPDLGSCGSVL